MLRRWKAADGRRGHGSIDRSVVVRLSVASGTFPEDHSAHLRESSRKYLRGDAEAVHTPKENYSMPTVAFEDGRDKLPAHNLCGFS